MNGLSLPLVLRLSGFLVDDIQSISALMLTNSRFNVILVLDCVWAAAFHSRNWNADCHGFGAIFACTPRVRLHDPDGSLMARLVSQAALQRSLPPVLMSSPTVGSPKYVDLDPGDPSLMLDWALEWPCHLTGSPGLTQPLDSGRWRHFTRKWLTTLRSYGASGPVPPPSPAAASGGGGGGGGEGLLVPARPPIPPVIRHVSPTALTSELSAAAQMHGMPKPSSLGHSKTKSSPYLLHHIRASSGLLAAKYGHRAGPAGADDGLADVDFSDFVVVDASTYGTMTRLALIGCNGSGKSTVIDAFAVSGSPLEYVTTERISHSFSAKLFVGESCVLTVFDMDIQTGQFAVFWAQHCREWDGLIVVLDSTVVDEDRPDNVAAIVRTVGRMLDIRSEPRPPVAFLVNKHDMPRAVSSSHIAALATCWLPPQADSGVMWCAQECICSKGYGVDGILRWLYLAAERLRLQDSPRKRPPPHKALDLVYGLVEDDRGLSASSTPRLSLDTPFSALLSLYDAAYRDPRP